MLSNFTPLNGAVGITISCNTSSSTRGTLPTAPTGVVANAVMVTNVGVNYAYLALGASTIDATTAAQAIAPGDQFPVELPYAGGSGAPTHAAGISTGGNTTLQITLGVLS